jgi:hypothetical protein
MEGCSKLSLISGCYYVKLVYRHMTRYTTFSTDQHLKDLSLQGEIQEMVRACLRASGRSASKTKVKTFVENPEWKNKAEVNKEILADKISRADQGQVPADFQLGSDRTHVTSLLVDRAETQKGDVTKTPGIQDYIHGLITRIN